jgi:hypothetical protein
VNDSPYIIGLRESISSMFYEEGYEVISTFNGTGEFVGSKIREKLILAVSKIQYGLMDDQFGNPIELFKYDFPDGGSYFESYQSYIYHGETYLFMALQDEAGDWVPESLWTTDEMLNYLMEKTSVVM